MEKREIAEIFSHETNFSKRFIPNYNDLEKIVFYLKEEGKRVVLTQGVWDLLHEGHARYLEKAKSYGDVLIVGVDSDELTRKRKGPSRPIVPQNERVNILVHLRHVDIVTIREHHHDMGDLIRLIRPDVLITSKSTSDFTEDLKTEYNNYCSEIVTLSPQATTSTTAKIRNITMGRAEDLAQEVKKVTEDFLRRIKEQQ